MATLYITEFSFQGKDGASDTIPAAMQLPLAEQTRTVSSTSAQSSTLNAQTTLVRLQTDTACFVLFGTNPTATVSKMPLAVNTPEYFCVPVNSGFKIAAITA
jgi:hypothetical protein